MSRFSDGVASLSTALRGPATRRDTLRRLRPLAADQPDRALEDREMYLARAPHVRGQPRPRGAAHSADGGGHPRWRPGHDRRRNRQPRRRHRPQDRRSRNRRDRYGNRGHRTRHRARGGRGRRDALPWGRDRSALDRGPVVCRDVAEASAARRRMFAAATGIRCGAASRGALPAKLLCPTPVCTAVGEPGDDHGRVDDWRHRRSSSRWRRRGCGHAAAWGAGRLTGAYAGDQVHLGIGLAGGVRMSLPRRYS